ncbi:hypothetical protein V6N11_022157 [Hibiscus sabdariffa]|uniref:Uncharacterized protein n=1 Tax=Hibiscus sabdariffa TaxID=183260 RepID=A0ABR2TJA8_9ROSI
MQHRSWALGAGCAAEGPSGVLLDRGPLGVRLRDLVVCCCCHHERNLGKRGYRCWIKRRASEAMVVHFYGLGYVF